MVTGPAGAARCGAALTTGPVAARRRVRGALVAAVVAEV
jgi:hypothetical protein